MKRERSICLCLDDFGLHEGINEAALALRRDGRVHALSCLVTGAAWQSGATSLRRDSAGPIDVGLHLDLTQRPLTSAPDSWAALWMRGSFDRLSASALRAEIDAQFDLFERHLGRRPDFVDGHQHVHQFPQVRDALVDVLIQRYPYHRPWVRSTRAAGWRFKSLVIGRLGSRMLTTEADLLAFPHNRRLLGVYDFAGGAGRYEALLSSWFRLAEQGDLLMCHASTRAIPGDPIAQARLDEYEVLSGGRFDGHARSHAIKLESMTRILDEARFAATRSLR
ncbi:ChbG/HpnK family deacetylase [Roseateles aquatilis]|uniref:ChbG/HpnK family deacetylase n=1 Tax=Roseateles aquatilis TaxID=431061 RepID=UPI001303A629|nr:ChbG/HpnK family deacetylase [Roseateles aquatilis]